MTEPTLRELGYLRILAREVGEQTPRARTSAQARREIGRLTVKAELMRRVGGCRARRTALAEHRPNPTRRVVAGEAQSSWTAGAKEVRWWT